MWIEAKSGAVVCGIAEGLEPLPLTSCRQFYITLHFELQSEKRRIFAPASIHL
jgi:hypothetical protein